MPFYDNIIPAGMPGRVTACQHGPFTLITVVHLGLAVATAKVYKWQPGMPMAEQLPFVQSDLVGKDDSAMAIGLIDGTCRLVVAQADPGQGGATIKVDVYDFPGVLPVLQTSQVEDTVARAMATQAKNLATSVQQSIASLFGALSGVPGIN